jgi:molecular chaperone DnaK (HSP70)
MIAMGYAAGARSVTLLAESSASILYNLLTSPLDNVVNQDGVHIGVDIGGGTTDITIVLKTQLEFRELATAGTPKDGGEHIDSLLVQNREDFNFY